MHALQLLFRASPAVLLLVLCLQLGISTAQEDTTSRRAIILDMEMPQAARAGEEVTLKLNVQTELRECMVIKTYLRSSKPIDGSFNYRYTSCLCGDYPKNFYWDFQTSSTVQVEAVVNAVRELGICPNDDAVIPISADIFWITGTLDIY